jgi:hypothetical protein
MAIAAGARDPVLVVTLGALIDTMAEMLGPAAGAQVPKHAQLAFGQMKLAEEIGQKRAQDAADGETIG